MLYKQCQTVCELFFLSLTNKHLTYKKKISVVYCGKNINMNRTNIQVVFKTVNGAQLVLKSLKCARTISLTPMRPELLMRDRMDLCSHVVYTFSDPVSTAEINLNFNC